MYTYFESIGIQDDFRDFRFRDRGMTSFTAEYRWPLWAATTIDGTGLDGYIFTDVGQVFQDPEQIKRENLSAAGHVRDAVRKASVDSEVADDRRRACQLACVRR